MSDKKKVKPICGNCRLYNSKTNRCGVAVLIEGTQYHLPVDAEDACFFEQAFFYENNKGSIEEFKPEVQQVKWWVEDPQTGEKTDGNGSVRVEYPPGFFGKEN